MDLEDVDGHTAGGGELLVTDVALEVLGFLMLNKNLLVLELSVAIVTPHLRRRSLLLLSHSLPSEITFALLGFLSLSLSLSLSFCLWCVVVVVSDSESPSLLLSRSGMVQTFGGWEVNVFFLFIYTVFFFVFFNLLFTVKGVGRWEQFDWLRRGAGFHWVPDCIKVHASYRMLPHSPLSS